MNSSTERLDSLQPPRLGQILGELGVLGAHDIERVLAAQQSLGLRFGRTARHLNLIAELDLQEALARQVATRLGAPSQIASHPELVTMRQPLSAEAEVLVHVRGELSCNWFTAERKAIAVLGIDRDKGSSVAAANLAALFARAGARTLLIDCNLHSPRQHEFFRVDGDCGVHDILIGRGGLELAMEVGAVPNLWLLPAGSVEESTRPLLCKPIFDAFSSKAHSLFDVILYDVSGAASDGEALTLACGAGGVLLVARSDKTYADDLRTVTETLRRRRVDVVCALLLP
jgi:Mrp family chromosome partitioning ATPase